MAQVSSSNPGATPAERVSRTNLLQTNDAGERAVLRETPGLYTRAWRRFRQNRLALISLCFLMLISVFVLGAGLISRYITGFDFSENHLADALTPVMTNGYILGSDGNGRDMLTRLAYGGRISLAIALLATLATIFIGGAVGLSSGFFGGIVDLILMRVVDVLMSIPGLPLLILVATLFRPGPVGLALILAAISWPGIARIIRGEVLSLRGRDFVDAARVVGASPARIILHHIQPNILPLVIVYTSLAIPVLIIEEATLSFLGVGVQVPTPSWGNMLLEAMRFFRTNVGIILIPGAFIYFTALAFSLVGNGLRDALDPKLNA
ncbi:MAG: ABC transporter permease [Chloroflexota bacterium]|nr:ABC transporter permease [Chloroflexota bacterium]